MQTIPTPYPNVNRVEIIDDTGRGYVASDVTQVVTLLQDDGKTLKIFLKKSAE